MLIELDEVRQIENEGNRRWFRDSEMDLILWYSGSGAITGFQLCYDKENNEHAITWRETGTYTHDSVDTGDTTGHNKRSPVLAPDGFFDKRRIMMLFEQKSENVDPDLRSFILDKIEAYK